MRNLAILFLILSFKSTAQDASGNAVILNASPMGAANDVIYLQGSGFGASPQVQYSFNDNNWTSLTPSASGNETAMVQLPADGRLPDLIQIEVSPDGYHWSAPVYVNQARAYSFDTDQVGPGSQFRIFGRSLVFSRTPTVRLVDTADGSSYSASIDTADSLDYALVATAPTGIQANHTYSVYVSNGYNGNAASGGEVLAPATIKGRPSGSDYFNLGVSWASDLDFTNNVYNVQTDSRLKQHARGDGSVSDQNAVAEAILDASNDGGGIVYLPAGTYNFYFQNGCGVTLLSRVVLMGQGANNTFVNWGFGSGPGSGTGYSVCFGLSESGVSDITFTNQNQGGNWRESALGNGANETFIQRTNWNISTARWIVFEGSSNSTMQNSTLTQGLDPSYNGPFCGNLSTNLLLRNNTIKYVAGGILLNSVNGAVLEHNTIIRDVSQTPPTPVITHVLVANFAQNLMLLQNMFQVSGGTLPVSNDGETINSEAGGGTRFDEFRGTVQSASANSITDNGQNFNWTPSNYVSYLRAGSIVAIVAGKGAGQWSVVNGISADGHTLYLTRPWIVAPAAGSHYATFDWSAANWIIAGNKMFDNEKGIEFFDASMRDVLITNNQLSNNSEILISPTEQPNGSGLFNLVLNTQITNNTLTDTNHLRPAAISIVPREDYQNSNFGTAVIGMEIRGNSITGYTPNTVVSPTSIDDSKALTEGLNIYWQWQTLWSGFQDDGTPSVLGTVVEGNTFTNSSAVMQINSGVYQTVLYSNGINNSGSTVDTIVPGTYHASVGTVTVSGSQAPRTVPAPPATPNPPTTPATPTAPITPTTPIAPAAPPAPTTPAAPSSPSTPGVWNQLTVGSLASSPLASQPASATMFSLAPSLYLLNSVSDSVSMLEKSVPGDTSAIARIDIPSGSSDAAIGSIVFRGDSSPTSPFVSVGVLATGEFNAKCRTVAGGPITNWQLAMPNTGSPLWVKITKSRSDFQVFFSFDGNSWNFGNEFTSEFGFAYYIVGLESLSDTTSGPSISFDQVTIP